MRWPTCSEALKLCCLGKREVEGTELGKEDKKDETYSHNPPQGDTIGLSIIDIQT